MPAQYEMNLRDYWLIIRRRRVIIVMATVLTAALAFWVAKQKVPVYQATAAVKFEQSMALTGLLVEVLSYNTADNIETQASLIKSSPILEEVARRMGRLPRTATGEAIRESKVYTGTLESLSGKLRTNRVGGTSILEITATSTSALEARDLANTVAEVYRDYNKTNRNARIIEARKFIEAQLKEVEGRVRRAEEEVWAFRDANRIISPGAESTMLLSLFTQVRGDIEKARQQRIELEQVQQRLERTDPVSVSDRVFIDTQSPAIVRLQATQTDLILERNNLALEVTDKHPRLQAIDDRLREVRREMRREVAAQIALLRNREEILGRQQGELLQRNREVPAVELSLQRLQRDAKVNDDLLTLLKTRHQEALIKESEGVEEVSIVRPATEPGAPVGSETLNTVLVGGLLGFMLGLVLAFVQETLDTSIGTIEDVESYLEVPVLGIVPHIDPRETMQRLIERRPGLAQMDAEALRSHALLITHFDPKSPVAEAYRSLRTHIQFARQDRGGKVLVVTSPTLQEGKTTTIVNLALTMAQSGQKTLLIGANMRRPSIYRFFGIEREPGLSDILVGNARWRDCIRTVADILMGRFEMEDIMASPGLDNLHIIEAGPIPANPSELLSTSAMATFLHEVAGEYDVVLIDTPPVLPVTDSAIVASQADGVLLVYQAGKVGRLVLKRAKVHLESARAKVWGVVLNDVQTEVAAYTYTHYYTHYYGEETPSPRDGGSLQRAWDSVRSKMGRGSSAPVVEKSTEAFTLAGDLPRRRGSRQKLLGILGVVVLLGTGAGVAAWQLGALDPQRPLAALRERLGIGAPPPSQRTIPSKPAPTPPRTTPPATPGAPAAPGAPPAATWQPPAASATPRAVASVTTPAPTTLVPAALPPSTPSVPSATTPGSTVPSAPAPNAPATSSTAPGATAPSSTVPSTPGMTPSAPAAPKAPATSNPSAPAAPPAPEPAVPTASAPAGLAPTTSAPRPAAPTASAPPAPAPAATPATAPATPAAAPATTAAKSPDPAAAVAIRTVKTTALFAPATPSAPAVKSPAPAAPAAKPPAPMQVAAVAPKAPADKAPAPAAAATSRFALELGPFKAPADAERVEQQLMQAGYATVRPRKLPAGPNVYAVLLERIPGATEAQALVSTLREQGYGEAVVTQPDPPVVRLGEPVLLRRAVELAERLRAAGYQVRVAAQPGEAAGYTIRHGAFPSRPEAEARAEELGRLGLSPQVVQVR